MFFCFERLVDKKKRLSRLFFYTLTVVRREHKKVFIKIKFVSKFLKKMFVFKFLKRDICFQIFRKNVCFQIFKKDVCF